MELEPEMEEAVMQIIDLVNGIDHRGLSEKSKRAKLLLQVICTAIIVDESDNALRLIAPVQQRIEFAAQAVEATQECN